MNKIKDKMNKDAKLEANKIMKGLKQAKRIQAGKKKGMTFDSFIEKLLK